jgi:hypothetical protein
MLLHIMFNYPDEVKELAKFLPYNTDEVMGVYKDHNRNIKFTEQVLRHHATTGKYIKPEEVNEFIN